MTTISATETKNDDLPDRKLLLLVEKGFDPIPALFRFSWAWESISTIDAALETFFFDDEDLVEASEDVPRLSVLELFVELWRFRGGLKPGVFGDFREKFEVEPAAELEEARELLEKALFRLIGNFEDTRAFFGGEGRWSFELMCGGLRPEGSDNLQK